MRRGYLWTNLTEEIYETFTQIHPLLRLSENIPSSDYPWTIVSRPGGPVEDTLSIATSILHKQRREAGKCIDCGALRHPHSRDYCNKHRRVSFIRRREEKSTLSVKELRDLRRRENLCIDCGNTRDLNSKNYCAVHREADRLRAAAKRAKRMQVIAWTQSENRYEAFMGKSFIGYYVVFEKEIRASVMGEAYKICTSETEAREHILESNRARMLEKERT